MSSELSEGFYSWSTDANWIDGRDLLCKSTNSVWLIKSIQHAHAQHEEGHLFERV